MLRKRVAAVAIMAAVSSAPVNIRAQEQDTDRFPKVRLLQGLRSTNAAVRDSAMESLEEYGQTPEVAEVLITVLDRQYKRRARLRSTTLDMLRLLASIDTDEVADAMLKYLDSAHYQFVIAASDQLSQGGDQRALEPLLAMHERKEFAEVFGLRKCVTDALARYQDKRVVEYALARLPEAQGTIRYDLLRYLMRVGRQDFGVDLGTWNVWWSDNHDDFEFPEAGSATDSSTSEAEFADTSDTQIKGLEAPRYYNMPIVADRVVFVLDRSGSMAAGDDTSRLKTAKIETKTAINSLADKVQFAIVMFDARVRLWKRQAVAADDESKKTATEYIDGISTGQGTSSYDALLEALQMDSNTEAVFFLSDGNPSSGEITEPDDIVKAIATENYFRRATIYSIGVGVTGETEEFMRSLAEETGGVYRRVGGDAEADQPIARRDDDANSGRDDAGRPAGGRRDRAGRVRRDDAGRPVDDIDS